MFVDLAQIKLAAGNGGNGKLSFRHEKYVEKGGPDGGDGGHGGSVVFKASRNKNTLAEFRFNNIIKAQDGVAGDKRKKHGRSGKDLFIDLPVGTVVINNLDNSIIADLTEDGQEVVIAKGGRGGFGNAHFKSSIRQAPRLAEKGEPGESLELTLEMKIVADVGIIGLPNAGKSTLLSVITSAKPEIGNFAFTTTVPNLGVVDTNDGSLLVADIPGLIEGASSGKGLGDEFLRHVSRCKILLHLIDSTSSDIAADYTTINTELKNYSKELAKKPQIIVLTKLELIDADILQMQEDLLKPHIKRGTKIYAISASAHIGLKELLNHTMTVVNRAKQKELAKKLEQEELPVITLQERPDAWIATKLDKKGAYLVTGEKIEGFAKRTDFAQTQAVFRLRDILKRMGILNELVKQGIEPGDKIFIGDPTCGKVEY